MRTATPPAVRFAALFDRRGEDECWPWLGYCQPSGHARFQLARGRPVAAYRFAYAQAHGPIPDGLCVCHSCDNPKCVNPAHLWLGTALDNMRDMHRKGRASPRRAAGMDHYNAQKRHCPQGHPLSGDNLHINTAGSRVCRTCKRQRQKFYRERNK